jgi:ferredoxin
MMTAMRRLLVDQLGVPDAEVLQEAFVSPPSITSDDAAAGTAPEPGVSGSGPMSDPVLLPEDLATVRFQRTGKAADLPPGATVLEAAEDAGVEIPFECRSGICGQCKTRLISGVVTMSVQDALTPADRAKRLILACQARGTGDVVVDA